MPQRLCICTSCTHTGHQAVFPISSNPGKQRCPACQTALDTSRPSRQQRGYNRNHELARQQAIAQWAPGQACAIGGEPLYDKTRLDLAHNEQRTGYLGLACWTHNRGHHD